MAERPAVSVLIPTHQRREALRECLLALGGQSLPAEEYEVVVSVDGSSDGTAEMLEALGTPYELRVAHGERRGRAGACNAALGLARGEVAVILDDDMRPLPELLARHRSHHPPGSRLCVMGAVPVALDAAAPRAARYAGAKFNEHLERLAEPGHVFVPRDFYSGNASLRAEVLREVGGFSESFALYGNEDVDLSLRLREAGVELRYDPGAAARQGFDKELPALAADTLEKGRTTVLLARRHPDAFGALRLAAPRDNSRPWLAARSLLLRLARRRPGLPRRAFALAAQLERAGLWRSMLFYRAVLDFAFWAGVDAELRESNDDGDLAALGADLHRGPIDLLLHG